MYVATYVYANHDPEVRLKVEAIPSDHDDSWVLVKPGDKDELRFNLGLLPAQARDLARGLFRAAAEAEMKDAEHAASYPLAEASL